MQMHSFCGVDSRMLVVAGMKQPGQRSRNPCVLRLL